MKQNAALMQEVDQMLEINHTYESNDEEMKREVAREQQKRE